MVDKGNRYVDVSDPKVARNFEASKKIISFINNEFQKNKIKFGVIIIPSKMRAIEQWALNNQIDVPEGFSAAREKKLIGLYYEYFLDQGIPHVDSSPYVVKALTKAKKSKKRKYFYKIEDGHPYFEGYESYAAAAMELMTNQLVKISF